MSDIKAQIEFLQTIEAVTEEFDAAYLTRKEDPERWEAAKAAFQEQRSFWRGVSQAGAESSVDTAVVGAVSGNVAVNKEEKN